MTLTRRFVFCWLVAATAALLTLMGCATKKQVQQIVSDSNAAIAASAFATATPTIALDPGATEALDWQKTVDQINAFITAHPDQGPTINALRLRAAILLMNAAQPNQAQAMFNEIDSTQLANRRDQALYALRNQFLWWSRARTATEIDFARARRALSTLADVKRGLDKRDDTRRYLEQMRMFIAIKYALQRTQADTVRAIIGDATTQYTAQFDTTEHAAIQAWGRDETVRGTTTLSALRWYDFVPTAFNLIEQNVLGQFNEIPNDTFTPAWISCLKKANTTNTCPPSP